jgi:hypothetical protein
MAMTKPNLVSDDRAKSRLLVVEVKRNIVPLDEEFFIQQLRSYAERLGTPRTIYYVLVDNDRIRFYEEASPAPRLLVELPTKSILRPYIGADHIGTMSEFLMAGMTMSWLRDLAIHWKEQSPPGSDKIKADIVDLLSEVGVHMESVP